MRRNLDRRVEVLFPLENAAFKRQVKQGMLDIYLADTARAHLLRTDGTYVRVRPAPGEAPFSAQDWFLAQRAPDAVPSPRPVVRRAPRRASASARPEPPKPDKPSPA